MNCYLFLIIVSNISISINVPFDQIDKQTIDCTRDTAEAIIDPLVFPSALFELQKDSFTGIETFSLANGDKVIIKNEGCEYYVLKFRIETTAFHPDTSHLESLGNIIEILFSEIYAGLNAPIDIKKANNKLSLHLLNNADYQPGDRVYLEEGDIQEFVSLDKIESVKNGISVFEITYSIGPL